ncbi:hypothetical protein [Paenibacillus sp. RC67]|uniref:hypothetical protein n=1 Tax=Paenibacillus sp. RC67 TaxID=3039392 RepID=UPI0024AD1154|nr:hypothetical protein [Paenibacillus sp. RC67]
MEPVQRTEREITYHVGWKRGKITLNQGKPTSEELAETQGGSWENIPENGVFGLNKRYVWRSTGTMNHRVLWMVLSIFPILIFALSLWLVYRLAIQPY